MAKPKGRRKRISDPQNSAVARRIFATLGYKYNPDVGNLKAMEREWNRIMKQVVPKSKKFSVDDFLNPVLNQYLETSAGHLDKFAADLQARFADAQSSPQAADAVRNTPLPDLLQQNAGIRGLESVTANLEQMNAAAQQQAANTNSQTPQQPQPNMRQQGKNIAAKLVPDWPGMMYRPLAGLASNVNLPQPVKRAGGTLASVGKNYLTGDLASNFIPGFKQLIGAEGYTFPVTQTLYGMLAGSGEEEQPVNPQLQSIYDQFDYGSQPPSQPMAPLGGIAEQIPAPPAAPPTIESSPLYQALKQNSGQINPNEPGKLVIPKYLRAQPIGETQYGNY